MRREFWKTSAAAAGVLLGLFLARAGAAPEGTAADALRTDIAWLADDAREGRMTPSPGLDASADYLADRFHEAGLAPGGDGGTYFQTTPFHPSARNVAGILRGSDPAIRDQFVIVSAHYDHLGVKRGRIYPGANDNASGAASLIEIAKNLIPLHPRRSVLFLALFGEEEGLVGSHYYLEHPLIPLTRTIADINLEQLGRTDTGDGREIARFAFSGPSYSDLPATVAEAAKAQDVTVFRKNDADKYFDRSDNFEFAKAGIVAHTVAVAFEFSDYHKPTDIPAKIDYENLAKVDGGIAAGVAAVANAANPPKWTHEGREELDRQRGVRSPDSVGEN